MIPKQRGIATLMLCLVLTIAAGWLALSVMQYTLGRQRLQSEDYHQEAVFTVAEAALAFAVSWLGTNTPPWQAENNTTEIAHPDELPPGPGGTLRIRQSITYRRDISRPSLIRIESDASTNEFHCQLSLAVMMTDSRPVPLAGSWRDFE